MMKKIFYILLTILIGSASSCKKFLDTKPTDFLSPVNYYDTAEKLNYALDGVYDILGQRGVYGDALISRMGTEADEGFYAISTFSGPQVYNHSTSDSYVTTLWQLLYDGINRANILIDNINKPTMDENARRNILGQAKFLRAYYYFLLVSNWGDVPLTLTPTSSANNTSVARTPAAEVYKTIISEMTEAEPMVQTATQVGFGGRVNRSAIDGILARVCLYMAGNPIKDVSKYKEALTWSEKVINSGEHSLNPSYQQVFINYAQDLYDIKESIWEVEFWGNTSGIYREGGRVGINTGIANSFTSNNTVGYVYGFIQTTAKLFNSYASTDLRRDWAIGPWRFVSQGTVRQNWSATQIYERYCGKWRREYEVVTPKSTNDSPENFPLLRYSDVLLMYAEAENQVNGPTAAAYNAINQVRRRAYGKLVAGATNITAGDVPPGLTQAEFTDYIKAERSRELCFEGLRKGDLIRWGVLGSTMKALATEITATAPTALKYAATAGNNIQEPRHLLLPVPAYEMGVNPLLVQNPGW